MSESFELGTVGEREKNQLSSTGLNSAAGFVIESTKSLAFSWVHSNSEVGSGILKKSQAAEETPMTTEMKENTEIGGFYPPLGMKIWRFSRVTLLSLVVASYGC